MKVRAELRCFHCGYVAAYVEGDLGEPWAKARVLAPAVGPGLRGLPTTRPRCGRCGGPLYLDDVKAIRYEPTVIVPLPRGRGRGRPRKILVPS